MGEGKDHICKVLTEEILRKCWHEWETKEEAYARSEGDWPECKKCHARRYHLPDNPDFSDRNQLGELYDAIYKMGLWLEYMCYGLEKWQETDCGLSWVLWIWMPDRAFDCIFPWWMGRKK